MDEEQLVEKEQPTARPRLEYEEGFKRIYIVLGHCQLGQQTERLVGCPGHNVNSANPSDNHETETGGAFSYR